MLVCLHLHGVCHWRIAWGVAILDILNCAMLACGIILAVILTIDIVRTWRKK
jgi:hypothetical protein